jgi:(2Fe-2S) ferredoxin
MATCGQSAGARRVMETLKKDVAELGLDNVNVAVTGCVGMCTYEPILEVLEPGKKKVTYIRMDPEKTARVVKEHLQGGKPVLDYTVGHDHAGNLKNLEDLQFYAKQERIVLRNCGTIDPENIHEYIAREPSWTAASWRATPTPSWKPWPSAATPSGPARATSTSAPSIPWPSSA